ncbi:class II fructose-bisphosphate aldolase [Enterococcus hirae]|nr:class II fructose-bisphosphate aldolase [Enterococcus hirae]
MLVNMKEILAEAEKNKSAIGCINTPDMELLKGIIGAAEELGTPIIIDHAQVHDSIIPVETIAPYMIEAAKRAKVPVCVHVDHGRDMSFIMRCIEAGFTSVMIDRSDLPFEENIKAVKQFVSIAHAGNLTVEAEFDIMPTGGADTHGGIVSEKDMSKYFTDPLRAAQFAEETKVDALACLVGTVHGFYSKTPHLDIKRIEDCRKSVTDDCRLVLHGASGVPEDQIHLAINAGISKINYYSYMSTAVPPKLVDYINESNSPVYYHELALKAEEIIKDLTKHTLQVFMNKG